MKKTSLLPPITAVWMVWALTGEFSKEEHSKLSAVRTRMALKNMMMQEKNDEETEYFISAIAAMDASLRSLDTIYKGREVNFKENEKLRISYLDSVKKNLEFGMKAEDIAKSLPAMTIGSAGGITLAQYLASSGNLLWAAILTLAGAGAGYLINLWVVRRMTRQRQMLYIAEDYERSVYFEQYVTQVVTTLTSLYLELDRIHAKVFGQAYPEERDAIDIIRDMVKGIRSTWCEHVHDHMIDKKITPERWYMCETGHPEAVKNCRYWKEL